jgi:hypothetical protein
MTCWSKCVIDLPQCPKRLPGDEYKVGTSKFFVTNFGQLFRGEYTAESQLPLAEYTRVIYDYEYQKY